MSPESEPVMAELVEPDVQFLDESAAPRGTPCPSCGAPVEPGDRFCAACGRPGSDAPSPAESAVKIEQRLLRCENCGSEVAIDADQRSYVCAFCDSTYVVEFSRDETGRLRPEFVIGFAVTTDEAREKFQEWLAKNAWFRPGDLTRAEVVDKQKGVYLPFWSFSMLAQSQWSAQIGEYWWRTEFYTTVENGKTVTKTRRVQETEWWPLAGRHHHYYSGFLVSGSRGLEQADAQRIKPFRLESLKRYEPFYLAGWMSEEYSIGPDDALTKCREEFLRRERANVAAFMPGDTHRGLDVDTQFHHIQEDLCLLPVYVLSYRYKEKLYRFLVNGQTGRSYGTKPLSWRRIMALVGSIVGLVLLVVILVAVLASLQ